MAYQHLNIVNNEAMGSPDQFWLALIPPATIILWELIRPLVKRVPGWSARAVRAVVRFYRRRIYHALRIRQIRRRHGERIANLIIDDYAQYRSLSEFDQKLFSILRSADWLRLLQSNFSEQLQLTKEWSSGAQQKADQALPSPAVFTKSREPLQCYNCAFFGADLKSEDSKYTPDPYGGHCYRQHPTQDTYPEGFCGHHSALSGFLQSKAGIYNIAPVE